MNLAADAFAGWWNWLANLVCLGVAAVAIRASPWRSLATEGRQHVFAGATVACMVLWTITGRVGIDVGFHLLGTTVLTLMFGPALAFIAALISLAGISIAGFSAWQAFGLNAILMGTIPVGVSYGVYRLADRCLPNHLFVYVLAAAFLNGAAAMTASRLGTLGLLWLGGRTAGIYSEYLVSTVLLGWAEALLSGMLMTILVVYRPNWVLLFDDARYVLKR